MWWTGQTSEKNILPHLPNAIPPPPHPDEHALYKHSFVTGNTFLRQRPRFFWYYWPKGARPLGTRGPEMGELSKARDLVGSHCWHRTAWWKCVVPVSLIQNINAWDANCLLAINAQCLNEARTLRDRRPVKALHTLACCEFSDRDLKF